MRVTRVLRFIGRALAWVASVLMQVGGASAGGRSADASARAPYEQPKKFRP